MTKRLNETSPNENLIHRWMSWCDRVFHWIIGLMLLFLFSGMFLYPSPVGLSLLTLAAILFAIVLVPFLLIKLFTPGKAEPRADDGRENNPK